ncbi:tRNA (guanosine(37)-N1)-methyltransferase TrmD [Brevibacterium litoralis]|uniref:tRNA (guanosine(37)-N1)-methyltransferase TrmD n=1 Tax=Brevibacterium litoralis TaxID=3138935 RepID=UPI0032EC0E22
MRIDVFSIFPEYLAPLRLSLIGKAIDAGLLSVDVHDLRDWTHDRHRTVDDTPYGGGAGMVMKPEPWGEALDAVFAGTITSAPEAPSTPETPADPRPVLLVPSPAGVPFTQAMAHELAGAEHLVVACGRYEGIDQRVVDWAGDHADVRMVSIGDYVLNGGEVAAMVMIEAIARLIPGMVGNPESLEEESHENGLLEYPVYTKPQTWRGNEVPEILLSGNHGAIARWRRDRRLERTAKVRPDLLSALQVEDLDKKDLAFLEGLGAIERGRAPRH